ncbi:cytochrome c, partial [Peribacillus sp. SIMBA_075]
PSLVDNGLPPEEIAKIAVEGKGNMPKGIFKGSDEELEKLSKYLSEVKSK